jgi:hypothetical protein
MFSQQRARRWLSSGLLRHVLLQKLTNISEVLTAFIITLVMKAVSTSEMSVNLYKTTWCNNPEQSS